MCVCVVCVASLRLVVVILVDLVALVRVVGVVRRLFYVPTERDVDGMMEVPLGLVRMVWRARARDRECRPFRLQ